MRILRQALPLATSAVLAATLLSASALAAQPQVRGAFRFGLEHGGEKVVQFEYEDGSTPTVTAGGGLLLTGGAVLQAFATGKHAVELQAMTGIKWRTIPAATNQTANWLRVPIEGLVFYRLPIGLRLGAGATVHVRNALVAKGEVASGRIEFDATPGLVLQTEYLRDRYGFDLRYTALEYQVRERFGRRAERVGASSIGVGASFYFGERSTVAPR